MKILKVLKIFLLIIAIIVAGFWGLAKYKNRRITPDYYETYKTQDTVPEGKVGVFVTGLIMPETLDEVFFVNIFNKITKNIIPWPFQLLAMMDTGISLMDPDKYLETEEFVPTRLVDPSGSDRYTDGESYIEKYKKGEVEWRPPSKRIHKDIGSFVFKGGKGGMPTLTGKLINKARVWYYDKGIKQKKIPHWKGSFDVINGTMARIEEKYGDIEWRAESSLYYKRMEKKLHELLDAGCDTIVLAAPMGIYSHFEEFNSSFYHCFEYIEQWEHDHPGKKIKVIMAPPMGQYKPLRRAYLEMLQDRLDTVPEGSDVFVAVTVHGMPWEIFQWEAWLELAPVYRDRLFEEVKELLTKYTFGRTKAVICQDEFASHVYDPDHKYLSTNEAYWDAIHDGFDYAIGLPIEFFAENTDSMFYHALKNYEGFDDYNTYKPFDYPDWSKPFVMEFKQENTHVIYNGVPVGKYQKHVIDAFYMAVDTILSQKKQG